jgi:crotonobetainyl-CoA:carnitine CoA-transferase CaiB-like acyl-CoA transferase
VVLNNMNDGDWPKFCRIIGRADWLDDPRFADGSSRYRHMEELVNGIDEALAAKTRDQWGAIFDEQGIIWGPVLELQEVATDPHAAAIGLFPEIHHPGLGDYRTVNAPMRFHDADVRPRGPSPAVGQDTRSVLEGAGFSAAEIDALAASGAIALPE